MFHGNSDDRMTEINGGATSSPPLGTCPDCDEQIPPGNLLIKYETAEGWPKLFAECPACEDPVHPE